MEERLMKIFEKIASYLCKETNLKIGSNSTAYLSIITVLLIHAKIKIITSKFNKYIKFSKNNKKIIIV